MKIKKDAPYSFYSSNYVLAVSSFLLPFLLCVWQLVDAGFGRQLLSPFAFSDASLYHYSAWFKSVFSVESYVSEIIAFSPYESLLTEFLEFFGHSTSAPFLLNAILSGLTCVIIVSITLILFKRRSAWFALAIYSLNTPVLFFAGLTLKTCFVIFMASGAILLAILYFERRSVCLAIIFCLMILVISIDRIHLLTGLFIFLFFLCWPSRNSERTRQYRISALVILIVSLSAVSLSSIRYGAEPKYVSNVGLNIYLGHSKPDNFLLEVKGVRNHIIGHRVDSRRLAERELQRKLSQAEVTQYWVLKTLDYIRNNPKSYLRGQQQKLHHLLAAESNSLAGERSTIWHTTRWPLKLTFIDFAFVFSLFFVAAIMMIGSGGISRAQAFLLTFCFAYLFSGMATIVIERYRMVALVSMIPMAAWAAVCLCENVKKRWYLLVVGASVFASSQYLAYTAPAKYYEQFERHSSLERNAANGRIVGFYSARSALELKATYQSCTRFQRELVRLKFNFDLKRTRDACITLSRNRD